MKYVKIASVGAIVIFAGLPVTQAQEVVSIPGGTVERRMCYLNFSSTKTDYNNAIERTAFAALHRSGGCQTYPYRGGNYNEFKNEVHAGLDLRAPEGTPVFAIEAGNVVHLNFDGVSHSTLIVENPTATRKVLYLHMSKIHVREGDSIAAGAPIGTSGSVGAAAPHLHVEVWPKASPHYASRNSAITGTACPKGVCTDADIEKYTLDPVVLVAGDSATAPPTDGAASTASDVCKEPVTKPGLSGYEAALALGPTIDNNRADAIVSMVKGRKFREPQCGKELGAALKGATGGHRARAIEALVLVTKKSLSGEDAAAMLGSAKECLDNNRADAITYLAGGNKFKPDLSGKELEMILDGATGSHRARAIDAISNASKK